MKGLIHSKKFRQNLYKWLFVYIGVLGLLATVVTYSKYISSLGTNDEARITKFKVGIEFAEECGEGSNNTECNMGNHLPFEDMIYYFKVDTREIETAANIYLTASIQGDDASNYKITSIEEEIKNGDGEPTYNKLNKDTTVTGEYQTVKLPVSNDVKVYRAIVQYVPGQGDNETYPVEGDKSSYSLYIGYSASQVYSTTGSATPNN